MVLSSLFRTWWVILIQGIVMIIFSIIIFNNPLAVLTAMAFWLGIVVIATAVVSIIAYFSNSKESRDFITLLGSVALLIIGFLMISKILVTIKAITLVFGLLATLIGLVLIAGSWNGRKQWSLWWVIALIGVCALITGIKSSVDIYSGSEAISNLYGFSVLLSGIGLVFLAFLKKKIVMVIQNKFPNTSVNQV